RPPRGPVYRSRLGYTGQQLSRPTLVQASIPGVNAGNAPHAPAIRKLGRPRAFPLLTRLGRIGASRYRFRFIQSTVVSISISQCTLYWMGHWANVKAPGQVRLMASTAEWSLWLAVLSGWILLGGWFDTPTRIWFQQLAARRGYDRWNCTQLEAFATWRWLALWLAAPSVCVAVVATARIGAASEVGYVAANLALCLILTQLAAGLVMLSVAALKRFDVFAARRLWLLACIAPEAVRFILPGFPTLRTLINAATQLIVRWGASG
ncbi:MAG TPA: hypothetical protein VIV60_21485, partial [Polyangiaceae bacterium]